MLQEQAWHHNHKLHLRMQPGERDLPWGAIMPRRHCLDLLDNLQILQDKQVCQE
jgi:hypothetical protein